jgi:hypothetical protein
MVYTHLCYNEFEVELQGKIGINLIAQPNDFGEESLMSLLYKGAITFTIVGAL